MQAPQRMQESERRQIARELDLSVPDVQAMTDQLRHGLVAKTPAVQLAGEVEIDEV